MDDVDIAQQREAEILADRLEQQSRAASLDRPGSGICADCGERIPRERRAAMPSAIRCLSCQQWAEHLAKREPRP